MPRRNCEREPCSHSFWHEPIASGKITADKPRIHSRTVGKVLNGMLYTFNLVRWCPAEWNRPDVIQSRRDDAAWFLGEAIQWQIVFIDECGFNTWTERSQGKALRGDGAYRQVSGQKGRNINIILAVSSTFALVHHSSQTGGDIGMNVLKQVRV